MQRTISSRVNTEAVLQFIILLGFALFFFITILSGKARIYVHPRIIPYMKFGIGAMIVISLFLAKTIFKPKRRKANLLPYLFFIIPLMAAFILPAKVIDTKSLANNSFKPAQTVKNTGSNTKANDSNTGAEAANTTGPEDPAAEDGLQIESTSDVEAIKDDGAEDATSGSSTQDAPSADSSGDSFGEYGDTPEELKLTGNTIIVDDKNFVMWNDEIYNNMEKYEGKKIEIVGKVLLDKEMKKNEFAVVRLMMACCTADLQPVGILGDYDKAGELQSDSWVKVTGTVILEDYQGDKYPKIAAESVQQAQKPEDEYVYP